MSSTNGAGSVTDTVECDQFPCARRYTVTSRPSADTVAMTSMPSGRKVIAAEASWFWLRPSGVTRFQLAPKSAVTRTAVPVRAYPTPEPSSCAEPTPGPVSASGIAGGGAELVVGTAELDEAGWFAIGCRAGRPDCTVWIKAIDPASASSTAAAAASGANQPLSR